MGDGATELERALDDLYGVEPEAFVAERARLAKELRGDGYRSEAKELGAARRPTKAAAALNRVARRAPELVGRYLDRVRDVRTTPSGTDPSTDLRAAIHAQRESLDALVAAAIADGDPTDGAGSGSVRSEILQIVQNAAVDESIAIRLRRGRLVRAEDATIDYSDLLAGTSGVGTPRPPRRARARHAAPRTVAPAAPEPTERGDKHEEQRATAAARAALDAAQEGAEAADRAVDEVAATIARLERDLKAARQQHRTAERGAAAAHRAARDAAAALERLDLGSEQRRPG